MLKDSTYKEKFVLLNEWFPSIIDTVKKDLKNEHLKKDSQFVKKYFSNKNVNKLTTEELVQGYHKALSEEEKAEELAEFISNRWLLKNTEVYKFFEDTLTEISPNFSELTVLDSAQSTKIMHEAVKQFGAPKSYLFAIINSVVFPDAIFEQLRQQAKHEAQHEATTAKTQEEHQSLASMQKNHELLIARITDKYEKKLQGLEKKYLQDVDSLKKQISTLHRKLNGA